MRGENGRYLPKPGSEEKAEPAQDGAPAAVGAPRARDARKYARKRVKAEAVPLIEALLLKAKAGSVSHMRILLDLSGINRDAGGGRKGKTLAARLREEFGE